MNHFRLSQRILTPLLIAVGTVVLLLLLSRDSYLYLLGPRVDSAWFFMCGKAWMNGMVPYVDFSDAKGPLLWLIYGVGYLLSPRDYHGVFWMGCLFYFFTFLFAYRTFILFIKERSHALVATFLLGIIMFNPATCYEVRAEDFSMPFLMCSMWLMCKAAFDHDWFRRHVWQAFMCFGISMACTFFIKYSITAFVAFFPAVAFYYMCKRREGVAKAIGGLLCGWLMIVVPFLVYFLLQGNLEDFIRDYFIITFKAVRNTYLLFHVSTLAERIEFQITLFLSIPMLVFFLGLIAANVLASVRLRHPLPVLQVAYFFVGLLFISLYRYYFSIINVCALWGIVWLYHLSVTKRHPVALPVSVGVMALVFLLAYYQVVLPHSVFNQQTRSELDKIERVYQAYHQPKVTCIMQECGFGIMVEALPATKNWARQNGLTPEMYHINVGGIAHSDVVSVDEKMIVDPYVRAKLRAEGFRHCVKAKLYKYTFYIFTKTPPPACVGR